MIQVPGLERGKFTSYDSDIPASGKSTLLHLIGGLDRPDSGKVIDGTNMYSRKDDKLAQFRRKKIDLFRILIPSLNVWRKIWFFTGTDNRKVKPRGSGSFAQRSGLQDKKCDARALSGGQNARTAIARALVNDTGDNFGGSAGLELLITTELKVMSLLKSCVSDFGQTLIMITHDETIAPDDNGSH